MQGQNHSRDFDRKSLRKAEKESLDSLVFDQKSPCHQRATVVLDSHECVSRVSLFQGFMAAHSDYFRALFFGGFSEAGKEEIELSDVPFEDFVNLLRVCLFAKQKAELSVMRILGKVLLADKLGQ